MDRNQIIGMALITSMFVVYMYFFKPDIPLQDEKIQDTSISVASDQTQNSNQSVELDSIQKEANKLRLGSLSSAVEGSEELFVIENEDIQVTFSNKGGKISKVLLKQYLTYNKLPLYIQDENNTKFDIKAKTTTGEVNLSSLYYTPTISKRGDSTIIQYEIIPAEGQSIKQVYTFPNNGYEIGYNISMLGVDNLILNEPVKLSWLSNLPNVEYDLEQNRIKTSVNYFTVKDGFDYLSEASLDKESETLNTPIKWVGLKQKFFTSAIIADRSFDIGYVEAFVPNDTSVVKTLMTDLQIPIGDIKTQKANFKFYFGPNHFQTMIKITDGFEKNVNLGWPVINWINRFLAIPTFHFLDYIFGDMKWKYGFIIIILGILVKLILLPLSFKSYVAMAKMKVLKPELDVIKEKYGDDMQKVQSEQMALYSKVGINPLSGCIPVLLSMPVLLAMFSFFPNSIELRQQAFLWAPDLSTYDAPILLPFNIPFYGSHVSLFTLFMTLSTLAYTHFNNQMSTQTGPMKSISYIMPVIFLFVLNSFPAGLSFYYFISNLLTIGQQFFIKRFVDEDKLKVAMEENRKKNATGGGKKGSKFMNRVQDAMKAREEMLKKEQASKGKKKE
jgi:YidC/Oxa1 family membrane protein insertase